MRSKNQLLMVIIAVICLFSSLVAEAQIIGKNIIVSVVPDHKDWNYNVGETAVFTVNILKSSTLLNNVAVSYEAGPVMYLDVKKNALLKNGTMTYSATMKEPGFYRLKVKATIAGRDYEGWCTAAFSPEKLKPFAQCPSDFDEFWSNALKSARKN